MPGPCRPWWNRGFPSVLALIARLAHRATMQRRVVRPIRRSALAGSCKARLVGIRSGQKRENRHIEGSIRHPTHPEVPQGDGPCGTIVRVYRLLTIRAAVIARLEAPVAVDAAALVVSSRRRSVETLPAGTTRVRHVIGTPCAGLVPISCLDPRLVFRPNTVGGSAALPATSRPILPMIVRCPAVLATVVVCPVTAAIAIPAGILTPAAPGVVAAAAVVPAVAVSAAAAMPAAVVTGASTAVIAASAVIAAIIAAASPAVIATTTRQRGGEDRAHDRCRDGRGRERGQHGA